MKLLALSRDKKTKVDNEDFIYLNQWKWSYDPKGYAFRNTDKTVPRSLRRMIYLHRVILDAKKGEYCDHINGDKLDNQRKNLRICTNAQNIQNRRIGKNNTTGYKGVYYSKELKNWYAQITVERRVICLGHFETKEQAAKIYNKATKKYHKKFALLNKI